MNCDECRYWEEEATTAIHHGVCNFTFPPNMPHTSEGDPPRRITHFSQWCDLWKQRED